MLWHRIGAPYGPKPRWRGEHFANGGQSRDGEKGKGGDGEKGKGLAR